MTYLDQTPGAHLIYGVRKHHISVFVFQERSLPARLSDSSLKPGKFSFNMETWSQGGLRYFVIGDANAANIDSLARLFNLRPLHRLTTVMSEGLRHELVAQAVHCKKV
jgi:anti-sigma factor RsiW